MKILILKNHTFTLLLFFFILLCLPGNSTALSKPLGGVSIFRKDIFDYENVKISDTTATSGQTITSPCIIDIPPGETDITVYLNEAGLINFGSDTKINLDFDENKVSGTLLKGQMIVLLAPATTLHVRTKDGVVKVFSQNQETNVHINFLKGKTQVKVFSGAAFLNGVLVGKGQYFIAGETGAKSIASLETSSFRDYLIIGMNVIISSILGNPYSSDLNIDNMQINVGPMR